MISCTDGGYLKVFDFFKLCDNTNVHDINMREKEETDVSRGELKPNYFD